MNTLTIFIIIFIGIIIFTFAVFISFNDNKLEQLQRYWDVEIGMSEDEMLSIMGDGYNRSLLKNNRVKYEWRYAD